MLDRSALEDIFARFHGGFDDWLQAESAKLERAEASGEAALAQLRKSADTVCSFLRDYVPRGTKDGADPGADPNPETFATQALPRFVEAIDDDRRVIREATDAIGAFIDRRFSGRDREDIAALKANDSPIPMLKAALRLLAAGPKTAGPPGGHARRGEGKGRRERRGRHRSPLPQQSHQAGGNESAPHEAGRRNRSMSVSPSH